MKRRKPKGRIIFICVFLLAVSFIYGYYTKDNTIEEKITLGPKKVEEKIPTENENVKIPKKETRKTIEETKKNMEANIDEEKINEELVTEKTQMVFKTHYEKYNDIQVEKKKVPKDVIGSNMETFKDYVKNTYSNWKIREINKNEVELYKNSDEIPPNYYVIKELDGYLAVYKTDKDGKFELVEKTDIPLNILGETDIGYIKAGIKKKTLEEIYAVLEDYSS
ncbi:hypothetical protein [Anaeromicrobium sediminis]|uniref:Bypass of forespore C C-terminal domain-containing protein n=1 Tax=Anaeromicrobium sediminis TaxID=1478221 RepID=A0A267MMQ7_9FIRM|nr:hypothetical protein [Anaeromicrobium sediminis]PAB60884.1 hypothetical protein CCE28_00170 [Anaeromicrobium sediminis]